MMYARSLSGSDCTLQCQSDVHVTEARRKVHHLEITAPPLSRLGGCSSTYSFFLSALHVSPCPDGCQRRLCDAFTGTSCSLFTPVWPSLPPCLPAWLPHVPCPPLTQACVLTPTNQCAVTQCHASCPPHSRFLCEPAGLSGSCWCSSLPLQSS